MFYLSSSFSLLCLMTLLGQAYYILKGNYLLLSSFIIVLALLVAFISVSIKSYKQEHNRSLLAILTAFLTFSTSIGFTIYSIFSSNYFGLSFSILLFSYSILILLYNINSRKNQLSNFRKDDLSDSLYDLIFEIERILNNEKNLESDLERSLLLCEESLFKFIEKQKVYNEFLVEDFKNLLIKFFNIRNLVLEDNRYIKVKDKFINNIETFITTLTNSLN